jgi:hypothetical protein
LATLPTTPTDDPAMGQGNGNAKTTERKLKTNNQSRVVWGLVIAVFFTLLLIIAMLSFMLLTEDDDIEGNADDSGQTETTLYEGQIPVDEEMEEEEMVTDNQPREVDSFCDGECTLEDFAPALEAVYENYELKHVNYGFSVNCNATALVRYSRGDSYTIEHSAEGPDCDKYANPFPTLVVQNGEVTAGSIDAPGLLSFVDNVPQGFTIEGILPDQPLSSELIKAEVDFEQYYKDEVKRASQFSSQGAIERLASDRDYILEREIGLRDCFPGPSIGGLGSCIKYVYVFDERGIFKGHTILGWEREYEVQVTQPPTVYQANL